MHVGGKFISNFYIFPAFEEIQKLNLKLKTFFSDKKIIDFLLSTMEPLMIDLLIDCALNFGARLG